MIVSKNFISATALYQCMLLAWGNDRDKTLTRSRRRMRQVRPAASDRFAYRCGLLCCLWKLQTTFYHLHVVAFLSSPSYIMSVVPYCFSTFPWLKSINVSVIFAQLTASLSLVFSKVCGFDQIASVPLSTSPPIMFLVNLVSFRRFAFSLSVFLFVSSSVSLSF